MEPCILLIMVLAITGIVSAHGSLKEYLWNEWVLKQSAHGSLPKLRQWLSEHTWGDSFKRYIKGGMKIKGDERIKIDFLIYT